MNFREQEETKGPEWGSKSVRLTPHDGRTDHKRPGPHPAIQDNQRAESISKAVKPTEGSDLLSPTCLPLTRPTSSC